ncbi:MAG: secondary thiamine-phosphate synthase enzyme YjbQ [Coriobacteriales bacterium]|jgi:secondary thiamine-phosphate synthase enzyme
MQTFEIRTNAFEMIDVTAQVRQAVRESGVHEGLCTVYCPHTTAAITINENADPDVQRDLLLALGDIFSDRREFRHCEGNSHAHLKSSVVGASETIPVENGRLALGTWQGIYFCEFDGPRVRRFHVQVVGS